MDMAGVSFGAYDDILNEYQPKLQIIQKDIAKINEKYRKEELDRLASKFYSMFSESTKDKGFSDDFLIEYSKEIEVDFKYN